MKMKKLITLLLCLVLLLAELPALPARAEEAAELPPELAALVDQSEKPIEAAPTPEQPMEQESVEPPVNDGGSLPYYVTLSHDLLTAETKVISNALQLDAYLNNKTPMNLVLGCDITGTVNQCTYWLTVRGAKSIDLNGHAIYCSNQWDKTSTLFYVMGNAYLEIYDSSESQTGWINYDGYIRDSGPAQLRDLFRVRGTLVLNGGTLEAGRSKSAKVWDGLDLLDGWKQVIGNGVIVEDGATFIMNGGAVYGRGIQYCGAIYAYTDDQNHIYINGGTVGGFGGANALRWYAADIAEIRGGRFFATDVGNCAGLDDQTYYSHYFVDHGSTNVGRSNVSDKSYISSDVVNLSTKVGFSDKVADVPEIQTLKNASPWLTLGEVERLFPEMEGVYCRGTMDALYTKYNQVRYDWEIEHENKWHMKKWVMYDDHATPVINVKTAWDDQGFVPEPDTRYHARCTVTEQINNLVYTVFYEDIPFVLQEGSAPQILTDLPETMIFYPGQNVSFRVEAGGDELSYQWEVFYDGVWYPMGADDEPGYTFYGVNEHYDGVTVRCVVTNEDESVPSTACTMRLGENTEIHLAEFTTSYYDMTGEVYVPLGGKTLCTDVRSRTEGVTVESVRWEDHNNEEPVALFTGQRAVLGLRFRLPHGMSPAEDFTCTLDGVPYEGWKRPVTDSEGVHCTYYWGKNAVSGGVDSDISLVNVFLGDTVEPGNYSTEIYRANDGYGDAQDIDKRYRVLFEAWDCDGEPIITGEKFLGKANYTVVFFLEPCEGWRFTSGTVVMLEGEKCQTKLNKSGELCCTRGFYVTEEGDDDYENHDTVWDNETKVDNQPDSGDENQPASFQNNDSQLIEAVSLSGSAPVLFSSIGGAEAADIGFSDAESPDKRYEVESVAWYCDGEPMTSDDFFFQNHNYDVIVTLKPRQGWKFSYSCAAEFSGAEMKVENLTNGNLAATKSWYMDFSGMLESGGGSLLGTLMGDLIDQTGEDGDYCFGVLTLNEDYTTRNTVIKNDEDGLVIYVEKDIWLYCLDGSNSALILNGDTTITGPGHLTIVADQGDGRLSGPACIQVNGCKLTIKDTSLLVVGSNGIRGDRNGAELVIDHARVEAVAEAGGIYGFDGGVSLTNCAVTSPDEWFTVDQTGFYRTAINHRVWEKVLIEPGYSVASVAIDQDPGDTEELILDVGRSMELTVSVLPDNAEDRAVTWSSSDTDTLSVSPYGKITGLRDGTATVTATASNGVSASVRVSVRSAVIPVTGVSLGKSALTLGEGTSVELTARVLPDFASDKIVRWSVGDSSVATISLRGPGDAEDWNSSETPILVTGVTPGESTEVTVETFDGSCRASVLVTVASDFVGTTGVTIDGEHDLILVPGDTRSLSASVQPANASDRFVRWLSTDPDTVAVDENGGITALGCGAAQIEAQVWHQNGYWTSDIVNIYVQPRVTGVSLSAPANVLQVGGSVQLNAFVFPKNAADRRVTWLSSNEEIATVGENGVLTALSEGTVTVTCFTVDGGFTDEIGFTVEAAPRRVSSFGLSQYEMTLPVGGSKPLDILVEPWNADDKSWTCTVSSPMAVAAVAGIENETQESCRVAGYLPGAATLTFKSGDGSRSARLRVRVLEAEEYVPVESLGIEDSVTIGVGQSLSLVPDIYPENASDRSVLVSCDTYSDIISVEDGRVIGVSEGCATVSVTVDGVTAFVTVYVVKPVESLRLEVQSVELGLGQSQKLTALVEPADAYDRSVAWESGDESIVTVDPDGTLRALGYGTTYVTASTKVFPFTTGCTVTVVNNRYDLSIDGEQVTDENRADLGGFAYDPETRTLSVSGDCAGSGSYPLVESGIEGLTIQIDADSALTNTRSVFVLNADTTVTGAGTLSAEAGGAAVFTLRNGAALTVRDAELSLRGSVGFLGSGSGEALSVENAQITASGVGTALSGLDGGIGLSRCYLSGGATVGDGIILNRGGSLAARVEVLPIPPFGEADFLLPAGLSSIEDNAFEGIAATAVRVPEGCASIGKGAFRTCPNLERIEIPADCAIGDGAFEGCGTVLIYAPTGSPAQSYCSDPVNVNCVFAGE